MQPVTNISYNRYVFKNGTLFFPASTAANFAREIHHRTYHCVYPNMADDQQLLTKVTIESNANSEIVSRSRRQTISMVERFRPQAVPPGTPLQLWCSARGSARITWARDGVPLPPAHGAPLSAAGLGLQGLMRGSYNISRALPEDAGTYSCTAMTNGESVMHEARIDVYGPPYIRPMGPAKTLVGSRVSVYCPYYGYPISKIQWEHNGQIIGSDFIIPNRYKRSQISIEPDYDSKSNENFNEIVESKYENLETNYTNHIVSFIRYKRNIEFIEIIPLVGEKRSTDIENYQFFLERERNAEIPQNNVENKESAFIGEIPLVEEKRSTDTKNYQFLLKREPDAEIPQNPGENKKSAFIGEIPLVRKTRSPESENVRNYLKSDENYHNIKVSKNSGSTDEISLVREKLFSEYEKHNIFLARPRTAQSTHGTVQNKNIDFFDGNSTMREKRSPESENDQHYQKNTERDIINNETTKSSYQGNSKTEHAKRSKRSYASNQNGVLIIENVNSDDSEGLYTCSVSNTNGEMARRAFELIVMEPPVIEAITFGQDLQEGQIAQATCSIRGGDTPIFFTWLKDGLPILANLKIEERSSELFSVLIIKKVKLQHCGKYTCVATNHAARVNQSAELFIKVAPKWVEEPQNTSFLLGKLGQVACSANGYPQPQVLWMKKDENTGSYRPVMELRGSGLLNLPNGTLVLELVTSSDGGFYTCRVENGVGQTLNKEVLITVNRPVTFEFQSKNITTRIGHPITVLCEAFGDQPIRISWSHNGKNMDFISTRAKISSHQTSSGAISEILISSSSSQDAGEYQCRASNPHGIAHFLIYLVVQEPPGPPLEVSVEAVRGRTVRIGWRAPALPPALYMLQFAPHHHLHWDTANTINITNIPDIIRQSAEISGLHPATPYAARICSAGQAGQSPYTRPVLFTTLEEAPTSAPLSVKVESGPGPGELQISWQPPPTHTHHGILLGYQIRAVPQITHHSDDKAEVLKASPNGQTATLAGLMKGSRYAVTVSCYNSAGVGPASPMVYRDTPEGAPEESPEELQCSAVSSSSMRVSWRPLPLHLQGGAMIGYTLLYSTTDGIQHNMTSVHSSLQLDSLQKFTNYTVWVFGHSRVGLGPPSPPITCSTLEDIPTAPADAKALVLTSSSLVVSWLPPLYPNGRITHYTVYLRPIHGGGTVQSYRVSDQWNGADRQQDSLSHAVRGLEQGRRYEAWVTAATLVGEGEPSRTVSAEPSDRVVAGVSSLGGRLTVGAGSVLRLACRALGSPQPRTVWYHNTKVITHHPSFILNTDDSLYINNINPPLEGNYTCVAKNLFGWDSVSYVVDVVAPPAPPHLRALPERQALLLEWAPPNHTSPILGYDLKWRRDDEAWQTELVAGAGAGSRTLAGLTCGKQYEVHLVARGMVGPSRAAIAVATTLGSVMTAATGIEWIRSNSTHISLELDSWRDGECGVPRWSVDYRPFSTRLWLQPDPLPEVSSHRLILGRLQPATWYMLRVTAVNLAGPTTAVYTVATKTENGDEIEFPNQPLDASVMVMVCSCVLLLLCLMICAFVAVQKHRHKVLCGAVSSNQYKNSDARVLPRSESEPPACPRLYSSPICTRKPSKANTEMFEISPYAQFTMGFQTFGHAENQDRPGYIKTKPGIYSTGGMPTLPTLTDTSFQACSESDDSDSLSKSTTIAKGPSKMCRVQYHR